MRQDHKPDTDPRRKKIIDFFALEGSSIPESVSQFLVQQCQQLQRCKNYYLNHYKIIKLWCFQDTFFVASTAKQQSHSIGLTVHGANCHLKKA